MALVTDIQRRELATKLHQQRIHLAQLHHDDLAAQAFLVLDIHDVFANGDAGGGVGDVCEGGAGGGGLEVDVGGVEGEEFCDQGREEHDEGAVLGTMAIQQQLAAGGDFLAAAERRFEARAAGPLRVIVHFLQGLRDGVEAVAGVGIGVEAECLVRCGEGLGVGRLWSHACEAACEVVGEFEQRLVFV